MGADILDGGTGTDYLYAGSDSDSDRFVFRDISETVVGSERDRLYEFDLGKDLIDLSLIDANTSVSGDQAFNYSGTTQQANSIWTIRSGSNIIVRGDVNGDAAQDFEIMVVGVLSFSSNNLVS